MPLVILVALASLVGIWAGSWIVVGDWWTVVAAGTSLALVGRVLGRRALFVSAAFLAGVLRISVAGLAGAPLAADDISRYLASTPTELVVRIDDVPERRATFQRIRATALTIDTDGAVIPVSGRAQIDLPTGSQYRPADRLRLRGTIESPTPFAGVDYPAILARQGIRVTIRYPEVVEVTTGEWGAETFFPRLRDRLVTAIAGSLSDPAAGLAIGLLVGGRSAVPADLSAAFATTGTSHLLAVSGFNVALVGGTTLALLVPIAGRRPGTIAALIVVVAYTLLNGAPPSAVRAAVMGSLAYLAVLVGRQRDAGTLLILTAAALVWVSPDLLSDIGFQLSVFATGGLVWIAPLLERQAGRFLPQSPANVLRPAATDVATTAAAILATAPIIAGAFGNVSLVALPANLIAAVFVPPAMVTALLALGGSLLTPDLGWIAAGPAWLTLSGLASLVSWFADWPIASVRIEPPPPVVGAGFYLLLGVMVWFGHRWPNQLLGAVRVVAVRAAPPIAGVCAALMVSVAARHAESGVGITIGEGERSAIVLTAAAGRVVVYGIGPRPAETVDLVGSQLPWWDRTIDVLILRDWEDAGGVAELSRRFSVRQIIAPVTGGSRDERLRDTLRSRGQSPVEVSGATTATFDGFAIVLREQGGRIDVTIGYGNFQAGLETVRGWSVRAVTGIDDQVIPGSDSRPPARSSEDRRRRQLLLRTNTGTTVVALR